MRAASKLIRTAWLVSVLHMASSLDGWSQPSGQKRVLVMHWYDRDYSANDAFDESLKAALEAASPGGIEYYSEYLETNRFPEEHQARLLSGYLRQKYAGRAIDVIVTGASPALGFLLQFRGELFPHTPIVFASERPLAAATVSEAGATGFFYGNTYVKTLDLALRLHPGTTELFVISGTLNHDKSVESIVRQEFQHYQNPVSITYLTDLTLEELSARMRSLPRASIVLYAWQQLLDQRGKIVETLDILARIAPEAKVPMYGRSYAHIGLGVVGGYVWTQTDNAAKLADLTLRVLNGTRPQDIPVENGPSVPMFDWRQLQRWGISEDRLPPGSIIQFHELTSWQKYKWRIVGAIAVFALQALLIVALLAERQRSRRTQQELQEYKEHLEDLVQKRTAELEEARDLALAANRAKSIFLANMSHELRTPLNAILGFSGMVLRDAGLSDQHRKDLGIVGSSGEHLLGLIDDILDMARIETGGPGVESASTDLHSLVNDTVNMLRERAHTKNLELLLDVSSQTPQFVRSDPGKLRQVLTNLVGNALKYTDEGSVVVRLDARTGDNSPPLVLIFEVEDTGIGIAPEDQARIFDPFVQTGITRTREGTGLGLSITRHFVQLLGGTIQVESTPRRGSRFRVEVPAQTAEESEVVAQTVNVEQVIGMEPGQPGYRILIVEDQRENWLLLQRLLQTAGFQVQVAEDGSQAVEAFRSWRPHFIWMDLSLPVLGGLEAARRIREIEGGREVRIVAVTASAFASQRDAVLAAGLDDFLRKPYRPREIFACMARHLGVRYLYGAGPQTAPGKLPATLRPEDLAALPAALRDELENAVISLDRERIALILCKVSEQDASLARALSRLADKSAYTPIFDALESCKSGFTQTSA